MHLQVRAVNVALEGPGLVCVCVCVCVCVSVCLCVCVCLRAFCPSGVLDVYAARCVGQGSELRFMVSGYLFRFPGC